MHTDSFFQCTPINMATFNDLPLEMVQAIVDCCEPYRDILCALCLTSKELNRLATPVLYSLSNKFFSGQSYPELSFPAKWWLFTRTLIQRPDLAEYLTHLYFPSNASWKTPPDDDCPPEVIAHHRQRHKLYLEAIADDRYSGFERGPGFHQELAGDNKPLDLLLSLCPKLELLDATIDRDVAFRPFTPGLFCSLKSAAFSHRGTRYGMDLGVLEPLFIAAPNLEKLTFHRCGDGARGPSMHGTKLRKVKSVHFYWSSIPDGSLEYILAMCPNLEELSYEHSGDPVGNDYFSPREAQNLILEHSHRLREFFWQILDPNLNNWDEEETQVEELTEAMEKRGVKFTFARGPLDREILIPHKYDDADWKL
ncbi:hypothetical protein QBC35DRAFT_498112 [Podospora australis]|uniref:F-box domain-containing protein n=1 Tax=Podospora australis TaxID=1536484 RepID=A0AAN7AHS9_9PEZI|nr:hypothetical protein QBC35DRAFT_498112 [Podospora australis]